MTRLLFFLTALVLASFGSPPASAQQAPTSEQIDLFNQLPPEEQRRLIEQVRQGATNAQDAPLSQPQTVLPRNVTQPTSAGPTQPAPGTATPPPGMGPGIPPGTMPGTMPGTTTGAMRGTTTGAMRGSTTGSEPGTLPGSLPGSPPGSLQGSRPGDMPGVMPGVSPDGLSTTEMVEAPLRMFGYDLFAGTPTTFAPATDIPVPVDYVVGPGDMVSVQLFGKDPGTFTLVVNRDGAINFPQLGPISVAGLNFDQMRELLQERVAQQMIGVTASIGMGELRSIRIFVLGEAERPGSYMVSSLSTITNALFVSGGVKTIGSLRNVQLKRDGELVTTLDLYDLLLRGDTRGDERLAPGDVIFIPPVGTQIAIDGEVLRPAIYELKGETTVGDLVQLAGGLGPNAYPQQTRLSRISAQRDRVQQDIDLRSPDGQGTRLQKGDWLSVPSVLDRVDNVVTLTGHVLRPGPMQYRRDMRLSDLVASIDALPPAADLNYVLIRREMPPHRKIVALSADLEAALRNPGGPEDILLMPRDWVRVFEFSGERPDLESLIDELRAQASLDQAAPVVRVGGRVRAPGSYPLEPGMTVGDLLRAGGALAESAYAIDAEVTRYQVVNGEYRQVAVINVDLGAVRNGDPAADILLAPSDFLNVREVTDWREQEAVELLGEVRFPGTYPIRKGETLLSVLERAGGATDQAYLNGAIFTREKLREREEAQVKQMIEQMEADLAALSLQQAQSPASKESDAALSAGQGLLAQLRSSVPVGRLAMDLPRVLQAEAGSASDIVLEDGDSLMIPGPTQAVTVLGEVQSPTSLLYDSELSRDDYINLSGGMTRRADSGQIYIVRANGQVTAADSRKWFRSGGSSNLMPGDTIVVPADLERVRPIPLWTAVTTIIYNLAISVAAVNSF